MIAHNICSLHGDVMQLGPDFVERVTRLRDKLAHTLFDQLLELEPVLFGVLLKFQRGSVNPLLGAGVVQLGQLGSEMRDEVWEERVGERSEGALWGDGREGLGVG